MNKFFFISIIICTCIHSVKAQVALHVWGSNYINVNSYQGYTAANGLTIMLDYRGIDLNIENWKLSVSVEAPIKSADGTAEFPSDKVALIPVNTTGSAGPKPIPSISEIGMPSIVPLNGNSEVYLVPRSRAPLYNVSPSNWYYQFQISYNIQVLPGAYLEALQGGDSQKVYLFPMTFRLYGSNNELIDTKQNTYRIDVSRLMDSLVDENTYSISVSSEAQKGVLEMKTLADYANGVKVVYSSGLNVTTNVPYQVSLRSTSSQFNSNRGSTLPLNVVKMNLVPVGSNPASVNTIELSSTSQIITNGPSTRNIPNYYDVQYWTSPADNLLIQAVMAEYTTTLLYEITPK